MKKYAHILKGELVTTYEDNGPRIFGGPWVGGESIEVDPETELKFIKYEGKDSKGKHIFSKKELPTERLEKIAKKKKAKEDLKKIKPGNLTIEDLRIVIKDILTLIEDED